jgi:hypothetical protein
MKTLELNRMEGIEGGASSNCVGAVGASVVATAGIVLAFVFCPPAGAAALVGAVTGLGAGFTYAGAAAACS